MGLFFIFMAIVAFGIGILILLNNIVIELKRTNDLTLVENKKNPSIEEEITSPRFILLKGPAGNIFWTTYSKTTDYSKDTILYAGDSIAKMTEQWDKHYGIFLKSKK